MARIRRGVTSHKKHKKVLKTTKGYRMTRGRLIKVATESMLRAGEYAFAGRRLRKRNIRGLWIARISGQVKKQGLSYSKFIQGLKKADIDLDRKILAHLALEEPKVFAAIVEKAKQQFS